MKRIFDIVMSFTGLIVLSPLFLFIAVLIILGSPGGVFFRGIRIGQYGKEFKILKFRSMKPDSEGKGKWNVGNNDERISGKIGRFLRISKLDELPQLFCVLFNKMSFVGPRPELPYYVNMYTDKEKPILDLKPGITDWASMVNFEQFREFTEAEDSDKFYLEHIRPLKLRLQLYYRYNNSFMGDLKCIAWTAYKLVTRSQKLPKDIQNIVDTYKSEQIKKEIALGIKQTVMTSEV